MAGLIGRSGRKPVSGRVKKYIPKNNNLFLGIICTQRTPIIELFLERFKKVEGV